MIEPNQKASLFVCLSFNPNERLVTAISRLVSDFCRLIFEDLDVAARIRARNEADPDRLREAESRLLELTTTRDPVGLYDRLIREAAPSPDVSGLGLARIRAEGELEVDYRIEGNELMIAVQRRVTQDGDS